ncbi:Hypothetical protein MAU_3890 [Metamycoplasma auris 15026]|uniref:Uncharacterized protein n=1 Tax=Metamycoplasma auris 15026 TaxID=1188233 RepID=N9TR93_9BACT|nr:hypothetical protein [Metamycoplasma auris]ENY68600.1 Hypothetical protein MAU_3890 [Metamycoplasma auris 15026]
MEYKDYSSLATKNKGKRVAKKTMRIFWILFTVIIGLITLGFMLYGLIIGVYQVFNQDTLRLFT